MSHLSVSIPVPLDDHAAIKVNTGIFVDGTFKAGRASMFDSVSPGSRKVLAAIHAGSEDDVNDAVNAAHRAFKTTWRATSPADKSRLMHKLADLVEEHVEELALLEALDAGMMLAMASSFEVPFLAKALRYYAGMTDKIEGKTLPTSSKGGENVAAFTYREPLGACALILPFNVPLMAFAWKVSAALATGNTVIVKPSEFTSLSALKVAELTIAAGFPPGVINVIPGSRETGAALANHNLIRLVSVTGSDVAGRKMLEASAAGNLKRVLLELGGKNPLIVFPDAELEEASLNAYLSSFFHAGQICAASERVFVHASVYDAFVEKLNAKLDMAVFSDPLLSTNFPFCSGPSINPAQAEKVQKAVSLAEKDGGRVFRAPQSTPPPNSLYTGSVVITQVTPEMRIMREEVFGAVMGIQKFTTEEEVIALANSSENALHAVIFTENFSRANRVARLLEAGTVLINNADPPEITFPFGGFKAAGWGKDGGLEAIDGYLQTKTIVARI